MTSSGRWTSAAQRAVFAAAAALTVVVAVAFDLFAGEAPLHAATLGLATALAAVLRLRLAGRQRLPMFICGCIISQPAIHAAATVLPQASLGHGVGNIPGAADLFVASVQTMTVIAIVVTLTYCEQALLALAIGVIRLCVARIRSVRIRPDREKFLVDVALNLKLPDCGRYPGAITRRGPPVLSACPFAA